MHIRDLELVADVRLFHELSLRWTDLHQLAERPEARCRRARTQFLLVDSFHWLFRFPLPLPFFSCLPRESWQSELCLALEDLAVEYSSSDEQDLACASCCLSF